MENKEVLQNPEELSAEALDSVNGGVLTGRREKAFNVGDRVRHLTNSEYGCGIVYNVFLEYYPYTYDVNFEYVGCRRCSSYVLTSA